MVDNCQRVLKTVRAESRRGVTASKAAHLLALTKRTVQKHLRRLADLGTIRYVDVKLTRRGTRLWFPAG